ncbi:hypothetical protein FGG08_000543 [Glutinoglossum americanum]|uniref:Uncharacterized protein n=1 Tax=Glutinoglossum americanum TaxID=1670608 RepID=A0A9P8IA35_9PEZI|nr:hypothetical protein FGG08_000543 [Glutinoglossum americanum]
MSSNSVHQFHADKRLSERHEAQAASGPKNHTALQQKTAHTAIATSNTSVEVSTATPRRGASTFSATEGLTPMERWMKEGPRDEHWNDVAVKAFWDSSEKGK